MYSYVLNKLLKSLHCPHWQKDSVVVRPLYATPVLAMHKVKKKQTFKCGTDNLIPYTDFFYELPNNYTEISHLLDFLLKNINN